MNDERITEMRQFICRWGSGNCWTGTLGTACAMIHELLEEIGSQKDIAGSDTYPSRECCDALSRLVLSSKQSAME